MTAVPSHWAILWVKRRASDDEDPYYYDPEGRRFRSFAEIERFLSGESVVNKTDANKVVFDAVKAAAPDSLTARVDGMAELTAAQPRPREYRGHRGTKKASSGVDGSGVGAKRKSRGGGGDEDGEEESRPRSKRSRALAAINAGVIGGPGGEGGDVYLDPIATAEMVTRYGLPPQWNATVLGARVAAVGAGMDVAFNSPATGEPSTLTLYLKNRPLGVYAINVLVGSDLRDMMPDELHIYKRVPPDSLVLATQHHITMYTGTDDAVLPNRAKAGASLPGLMVIPLKRTGDVGGEELSSLTTALTSKNRLGYIASAPVNMEMFLVPTTPTMVSCLSGLLDPLPSEERARVLQGADLIACVVVHNLAGANFVNGGMPEEEGTRDRDGPRGGASAMVTVTKGQGGEDDTSTPAPAAGETAAPTALEAPAPAAADATALEAPVPAAADATALEAPAENGSSHGTEGVQPAMGE